MEKIRGAPLAASGAAHKREPCYVPHSTIIHNPFSGYPQKGGRPCSTPYKDFFFRRSHCIGQAEPGTLPTNAPPTQPKDLGEELQVPCF